MFAYEVMSRRPISTNMLARTGSRRRSEMRAATWLPTEIPGREPSSRPQHRDDQYHTPIDVDMIVAVVGLCFGTRERTQMVSTVAGTDPAAKSPATRQSTLPFLGWIAVPAVFVTAA